MRYSLKYYLIIIILTLLLIFETYCIGYVNSRQECNNIITIDTIIQIKSDTIVDIRPFVVYDTIVRTQIDTLLTIDSIRVPVFIPVEQKNYTRSIEYNQNCSIQYSAYVSGYNAQLDSISFVVDYLEKRIRYPPSCNKPKPWTISVGVGYGIGIENNNFVFMPNVGIYLGYSLASW
ncbi:hypothetical protein N9251_00620 [Gammaproteobacteria bacterium]|nr:hypothetical protein [Gammaproteobacteria bacterium]